MPRCLKSLTTVFVAAVVLLSSVHTNADDVRPAAVTQAELDAAVARHLEARAADRERVARLLQRDDVRALASEHGIDLRRAEDALGTLDDSELQTLAAQAAVVDANLEGGDQYLRISLIALLLIIIIVILLVD